ncbi:MAG: AtpZ/AtpI family protein [Pyrinomonadaceae bacterium]
MIKSLLDSEEDNLLEIEPKPVNERLDNQPSENFPEINEERTISNVAELNTEPSENSSVNHHSEDNFTFSLVETLPPRDEKPMFQPDFKPESTAETIRKSGLAYAAGITLFVSIVFTMGLGWFADLMFGTSPWGIVGGIVLGSIVGFIQFFRITSQILKNKD